jgi:hypothetical protein
VGAQRATLHSEEDREVEIDGELGSFSHYDFEVKVAPLPEENTHGDGKCFPAKGLEDFREMMKNVTTATGWPQHHNLLSRAGGKDGCLRSTKPP